MQYAIVTGKVFRKPEVKIAKSGKEYVTIILQNNDKDPSVFWRILAFSANLIFAFKHIQAGDKINIHGALELSIYEKDGKWLLGRSIIARELYTSSP